MPAVRRGGDSNCYCGLHLRLSKLCIESWLTTSTGRFNLTFIPGSGVVLPHEASFYSDWMCWLNKASCQVSVQALSRLYPRQLSRSDSQAKS